MRTLRVTAILCFLLTSSVAASAQSQEGPAQEDIILDPKGGRSITGLGDLHVRTGTGKEGPGLSLVLRNDVATMPYKIVYAGVKTWKELILEFDSETDRFVKITKTPNNLEVYVRDQRGRWRMVQQYCMYDRYNSCTNAGMPGQLHGELKSCKLYPEDSSQSVIDCDDTIILERPPRQPLTEPGK